MSRVGLIPNPPEYSLPKYDSPSKPSVRKSLSEPVMTAAFGAARRACSSASFHSSSSSLVSVWDGGEVGRGVGGRWGGMGMGLGMK